MMLASFATIGLTATLASLKQGGPLLLRYLGATWLADHKCGAAVRLARMCPLSTPSIRQSMPTAAAMW